MTQKIVGTAELMENVDRVEFITTKKSAGLLLPSAKKYRKITLIKNGTADNVACIVCKPKDCTTLDNDHIYLFGCGREYTEVVIESDDNGNWKTLSH